MTNEELALRIQAGEGELAGQLWEQMARLVYRHCHRYFTLYGERCAHAGVTLDDLMQEGYLALMDAAQAYDPAKGFKLSSYLKYPLMNRVKVLLGFAKPSPLNDAGSIHEELGEDLTLEDMLEDETAREAMEGAIDHLWADQLHQTLDTCLATLTPPEEAAVRARFYGDRPTGDGQTEAKGLRKLRTSRCMRLLRPYQADIISRYGYNSSFTTWKNTGFSSTEYAAMKLLRAEQEKEYHAFMAGQG